MLHTKAEVVRDNLKEEQGVIDAVVGSTNVIDRMGDIIDQSGWDLKAYKKNPVILWGHNVKEERLPIGKALKVWLANRGKKTARLMFKVKFDLQDSFAAEIFRKIKDGFINTVSVGFLPKEWEELDPDDFMGGRKYTKQELLELSFVPVPANPEALIALRSLSKKDDRFTPHKLEEMYPDQKEKELESNTKVEVGVENKDLEKENKEKVAKKVAKQVQEKVDEKLEEVENDKTKTDESDTEPESKEVDDTSTEEVKPKEESKTDEELKTDEASEETVVEEESEKSESEEVEDTSDEILNEETSEKKLEEETLMVTKGVIPFKDLGTLPESEPWDGPGEKAKAEISDLKLMCTWFDSEKPDVKSSYKLPHHKAEGHKCVWRGVAAAMAALLGARGGVDIPEGDRKKVYNHLKKHYKQFDKEAPEFKLVEDQVLAGLDDELHALSLDREDKYAVRLIKKVLKQTKKVKVEQKQPKVKYTSQQIAKALELINIALSLYDKGLLKGGEK